MYYLRIAVIEKSDGILLTKKRINYNEIRCPKRLPHYV